MGLTSRLLLGIIAAVTLISATTISKETDGLMVPVRQVQTASGTKTTMRPTIAPACSWSS